MKIPLFVLVCLLLHGFVFAQTGDPASLPDPAEIFAPGIDAVVVAQPPTANQNYRNPIDNTARTYTYYDSAAQAYRSAAFPPDVDTFRLIAIRSDGTYLLSAVPYDEDPFTPEDYWVFDRNTGEYSHPDLTCGVVPPLPDDENTWVFYSDPRVGRTAICDSATGEAVALLPLYARGRWVSDSPDGAWVVWAVWDGAAFWWDVYAAERATHAQTYLGKYYVRSEFSRLVQWVDSRHGIIENSDMPELGGKELLSFDVTQPDSLKYAFTSRSTYYPDPPQYRYLQIRYVMNRYSDHLEHVDCMLSIYYPLQDQVVDHTLAYDCGNVFSANDDAYVYLGFNGDGTSSLYRFDTRTGVRVENLSGEIEWLDGLSPDGRYAVIVTDNDGSLITEGQDTQFFGLARFAEFPSASLLVIDTLTSQIVYSQPLVPPRAQWVNTTTLTLGAWAYASSSLEPTTLTLLGFSEAGVEVTQIPNAVRIGSYAAVMPDSQHVLVWTDAEDGARGISALDVVTNELTPLIVSTTLPNHQVELVSISPNGHIQVKVYPKDSPSSTEYVLYTFTLP